MIPVKNKDRLNQMLLDPSRYSLKNASLMEIDEVEELFARDFILYHIQEVTFEEKSPRKEAFENVISSMRIPGINFIYLIIGDKEGVRFFFGLGRDRNKEEALQVEVDDIGNDILKDSIQANFRGSRLRDIENERTSIRRLIEGMEHNAFLEGVPGINEDNEDFQGVDRLVDTMLGDDFAVSIIATPLDEEEIFSLEESLYALYNELAPRAKQSLQASSGQGETYGSAYTQNAGESTSENKGSSSSISHQKGSSESFTKNRSTGKTSSTSTSVNKSKSFGNTYNSSTSESDSWNRGTSETTTNNTAKGKSMGKSTSKSSSSNSESTSKTGGESFTEGTSKSKGETNSRGGSKSSSHSRGSSETQSSSEGNSQSQGHSETEGVAEGTSHSKGTTETTGTSSGYSESKNLGYSRSRNDSLSRNAGVNTGLEFVNKRFQSWLDYMDNILFPRLDYGKSKGLFTTNIFLSAGKKSTLIKLGNTMQSLYSGNAGNKAPLKLIPLKNKKIISSLSHFQFPVLVPDRRDDLEMVFRTALSQNAKTRGKIYIGNWMSTDELSLIAGIPQKEVRGLALKEEVEFGLNPEKGAKPENSLILGNLVRSGNNLDIQVSIDKKDLNKHVFIAGVTGSGKTTTCHRILKESGLPFMVIEPAKAEYRILLGQMPDLLIFTLGDDSVAPFRLNPFEFFPHENITSRVDMIKASIEAAFDMEAAIPQIIEAALYKSYEELGWSISNNKNHKFKDPFMPGLHSFPTLQDLIRNAEKVTKKQGFDDRLKNDYIGSIKARLQGLLVGAKGAMLNTYRSIDFREIVKRNVVFELDEIKNGGEKSLVMGFILANLNEALKAISREEKKEGRDFRHISLVEEAHRLLARYEAGDSPNKKQGIEVFSDMLAEVRKYGESLIIVDQIPNKLTSEVLKNTNTKIVHKIFAQDDKDAIGNTMALDDEQKEFLSFLETGRAIVMSQGFHKPVQVQIAQVKGLSTTETKDISTKEIRKNCLEYYCQNPKSGIIPGLDLYDAPRPEDVDYLLNNIPEFQKLWERLFRDKEYENKEIKEGLHFFLQKRKDVDFLEKVIYSCLYASQKNDKDLERGVKDSIHKFMQIVLSNKTLDIEREIKDYLEF